MLQILRNKSQSTFIQVIVVIIALVFIFWGVGTNMMNTREVALTVNDDEITFQQFQEAYDQAIANLSGQFGGTLPKGLEESLGIKQQVIEQLIQSSLLRQGATEMGIGISAEEVRNRITSLPQFQQDGQFNMERYQSLLAANRLTPTTFESSMRHDMLSDRTVQDIGKFVTLVPQSEIEDLYNQQNETVAVQFVRMDSAAFNEDIKVEKSDLQKWFESVKDNYRTAPEIKLRYLAYTFDDLSRKITVDEGRIQAYYSDNIDTFTAPEQRRARHILLAASAKDSPERHQERRQKAAEILDTLKKNSDFATLAKQYSDDPSKDNGGDLGFFSRGSMVPEFDAKVFSMQPGEISDIVKTDFGYHIIKLEEVKPSAIRSLQEVRAEIVAIIKGREAKQMAFQLANAAYEGIIKAGNLKAYTDAHPDADLKETDFFLQKQPPKEIGANQKLLDAAFALNKGELSSLIETDSGYAILFAIDKKPPVVPPLATVEDKVKVDFISTKAEEKARTTAAAMLEQLKKGKTLQQLTADTAFQVTASGDLHRTAANQTSAFPTDLHPQAFMLSQSSPLPKEVGQVGNTFYVYVFQERKPPAQKADEQTTRQYREALVRFNQQQLLAAWIGNLENQAKIRRHKSL